MELPKLGQHCNEPTCQQLDFLPMKCDACSKIYCRDHIVYTTHNCTESYKKDNQIPVCPLCNLPCPIKKGELPDVVVGRHIESDCLSDPAKEKRKVYTNKCSKKGCKQKELVPVRCDSCRQNYCLRHRHEQDHDCQGFQASGRSVSNPGAAAILRAQQATSKKLSPVAAVSVPSRSPAGSINRNSNNSRSGVTANVSSLQGSMSEEEALARALQMSMNGNNSNPTDGMTDQEREDFLLAQALAASEQEAAAASSASRQQQSQQRPQRTMDKCSVQ